MNRRKIVYLPALFLVVSLSSCMDYFYKTNTKPSIDAQTTSALAKENRFFIIHFSNSTNALEHPYVKNDSLFGTIIALPPEHSGNLNPDTSSIKNRVTAKDKNVLTEVHLYTNEELQNTDTGLAEKITSFHRADVYEINESASNTNHVLNIVGIVAVITLVAGAILIVANSQSAF